jgi:hypothetical protein
MPTPETRSQKNNQPPIRCRACGGAEVFAEAECPNCGFWCSPSCYHTFRKVDDSRRRVELQNRHWRVFVSCLLGLVATLAALGESGPRGAVLQSSAILLCGALPLVLLRRGGRAQS